MWEILFSTHHTDIGLLYIITSIAFLMFGGALALALRAELFLPGLQIFHDPSDFNRFFTVHGTTMLFLWAIPFAAGVGNYLIPIMIRYKDMAWPKLNAVAYWMIPVGAALVWLGFSDTGWTAYPPYSILRAPGPAAEMWIFGLKILGISSILGSINFIVTILRCKHPDLPIMKMPILCLVYTVHLIYDNCSRSNICRRHSSCCTQTGLEYLDSSIPHWEEIPSHISICSGLHSILKYTFSCCRQ